ncbi:MAG TPA: hypothetical protein VG389_25735 [Myxococcota bacterium]|jgi:hypothetical protein|nr:hypothetical protein [Myxococcota bacterium]
MRIAFVRTHGQPDRVYVRRSAGGEVSWSFPTYGDGLPHDLVHLVVESAFGVREGFWGRVDAGADPARLNAQANRSGGADKYAGFGADQRDLLLAEVLAGLSWWVAELTDADRVSAARDACAKVGVTPPPSVAPAAMAAVRATLERLGARWRALLPKGSLELAYDPAHPERGFTDAPAAAPRPGRRKR